MIRAPSISSPASTRDLARDGRTTHALRRHAPEPQIGIAASPDIEFDVTASRDPQRGRGTRREPHRQHFAFRRLQEARVGVAIGTRDGSYAANAQLQEPGGLLTGWLPGLDLTRHA